jgi:hypothetical protein
LLSIWLLLEAAEPITVAAALVGYFKAMQVLLLGHLIL